MSTNNFHVTSLLRHLRQNGKKPEKLQNLFLTIKILGVCDFHQASGKKFLEWIVEQKIVWDQKK